MTETTNPALAAVDDEYRDALAAWRAAKARYMAAGEARERAHRTQELIHSTMAQQLRGLSDEEWAELRQSVDSPMPFNATVLGEPGA